MREKQKQSRRHNNSVYYYDDEDEDEGEEDERDEDEEEILFKDSMARSWLRKTSPRIEGEDRRRGLTPFHPGQLLATPTTGCYSAFSLSSPGKHWDNNRKRERIEEGR